MESTDIELKRILKDWADRFPLPNEGRAQLLEAAHSVDKDTDRPAVLPFNILPKASMSWFIVYSMRAGTSSLRLVS
jgi:hypothetical protein